LKKSKNITKQVNKNVQHEISMAARLLDFD